MKRKLGLLVLAMAMAAPLTACTGQAPDVAPTPNTSPNTVTRGMEDMARGIGDAARDVGDAIQGAGSMPWDDGYTFREAEEFDNFVNGTGEYAYAPPANKNGNMG